METNRSNDKIELLSSRKLTGFEPSRPNHPSAGHFQGKTVTTVEPTSSGINSDGVTVDHAPLPQASTSKPRCTDKVDAPETMDLQLARCNYYYGDCSAVAAHQMLKSHAAGDFLLRNSKTVGNCPFALSMKGTEVPFSVRIKLENGRYEMITDQHLPIGQRPSHPNVTYLIDHAVDKDNMHRLFRLKPGAIRLECSPVLKPPERIHQECLERLEQCRFFYRDIDPRQVKDLLDQCAPGTFLLRGGLDLPEDSPFLLTIQTAYRQATFKVRFTDGLYYTDCRRFISRWATAANCVLKMIELFKKQEFISLLTDGNGALVKVFLSTPLERSDSEPGNFPGTTSGFRYVNLSSD